MEARLPSHRVGSPVTPAAQALATATRPVQGARADDERTVLGRQKRVDPHIVRPMFAFVRELVQRCSFSDARPAMLVQRSELMLIRSTPPSLTSHRAMTSL